MVSESLVATVQERLLLSWVSVLAIRRRIWETKAIIVVNALRSERVLPVLRAGCPNHEQHSHWQQIKPLHKRTCVHHCCQFGTGEDRQIEDAISPCNPCERGLFCSRIDV